MKKITLILTLFTTISFAGKQPDFNSMHISPNPQEEKEWRSSTIYKVISYCIELGGSLNQCTCATDYNRKHYKENEFLATRSNLLKYLETKNQTFYTQNLQNFLKVQNTISCQ